VRVAVVPSVTVFWYVTPCSLMDVYRRFRKSMLPLSSGLKRSSEDGGSTSLRNVAKHLSVYTAKHLRIMLKYKIRFVIPTKCRSHKARTLFVRSNTGVWVRIALEAWLFCVYCVFVLSYVDSSLRLPDPPPREPYKLSICLRNCKTETKAHRGL
jgi:hypothetical protein